MSPRNEHVLCLPPVFALSCLGNVPRAAWAQAGGQRGGGCGLLSAALPSLPASLVPLLAEAAALLPSCCWVVGQIFFCWF